MDLTFKSFDEVPETIRKNTGQFVEHFFPRLKQTNTKLVDLIGSEIEVYFALENMIGVELSLKMPGFGTLATVVRKEK